MPKIDTNPFQSGGKTELLSLDAPMKFLMLAASAGIFFAALSVGRATVQPLVEQLVNMVPGLSTNAGDAGSGPWGQI